MLEVHRGLLQDETRTNAFRDAIRRSVTPDSVVLDLGTGSGILSFFAAEAGARRVSPSMRRIAPISRPF
jgi:predicted RNA methylase